VTAWGQRRGQLGDVYVLAAASTPPSTASGLACSETIAIFIDIPTELIHSARRSGRPSRRGIPDGHRNGPQHPRFCPLKVFRDLHLQLDELVDFARQASDTIAERMRALDAIPDGRSDTVAGSTTLPQFPANEHSTTEVVDLITARAYAAVDTMRTVHDAVDAVDPSTADILHELIDGLRSWPD